jgi:hypothetical protein
MRFKPVIHGDIRGLENATRFAAAAVRSKPWLSFFIPGQLYVDGHGNIVEDQSGGDPDSMPVNVKVEYHVRIDPAKITRYHNDAIAAQGDRLQGAQRIMETVALASTASESGKGRKMTSADLPDAGLLQQCYYDRDEAINDRLVDIFMEWDYSEDKLTHALLGKDTILGEALQTAVQSFLTSGNRSSQAATTTSAGSGTTPGEPSTTQPAGPSPISGTQNPSLSASVEPYSSPENNGATPSTPATF